MSDFTIDLTQNEVDILCEGIIDYRVNLRNTVPPEQWEGSTEEEIDEIAQKLLDRLEAL